MMMITEGFAGAVGLAVEVWVEELIPIKLEHRAHNLSEIQGKSNCRSAHINCCAYIFIIVLLLLCTVDIYIYS